VVVIMWQSIRIATSRSMTMGRLLGDERPGGLGDLLTDQRFLGGLSCVRELDQRFREALQQSALAHGQLDRAIKKVHRERLQVVNLVRRLNTDSKLGQPQWAGVRGWIEYKAQRASLELEAAMQERGAHATAASAADERATTLSGTVAALLETASYRNLVYHWRRTGLVIIGWGLAAAAGIGLFAWAANPPAEVKVKASVATPAVLTTPISATVTLTAEGRDALRDALGTDCSLSAPLAALELGKTDAGADVLVQQPGCAPARFIAVPGWAEVHDKP